MRVNVLEPIKKKKKKMYAKQDFNNIIYYNYDKKSYYSSIYSNLPKN